MNLSPACIWNSDSRNLSPVIIVANIFSCLFSELLPRSPSNADVRNRAQRPSGRSDLQAPAGVRHHRGDPNAQVSGMRCPSRQGIGRAMPRASRVLPGFSTGASFSCLLNRTRMILAS